MPEHIHQNQKSNAPANQSLTRGNLGPSTPASREAKALQAAIQKKNDEMKADYLPNGIPLQVPVIQRKQSPNGKGLPESVKSKMESSFGTDFSTVQLHADSAQARDLGALAYTQGEDIHFAPGQFDIGSQRGQTLLGHELAHVVQQRQGRVQPTVQMKGVGVNDDVGLEREADLAGEKAALGENNSTKNFELSPISHLRVLQKQDDAKPLTKDERLLLYIKCVEYSNYAYTDFSNGAGQAYDYVNAEADANVAMRNMMLDIALVLVSPGISKGIGALANFLGRAKNDVIFYTAYAMSENADLIATSIRPALKKAFEEKSNVEGGISIFNSFTESFRNRHKAITNFIGENINNAELLPDTTLITIVANWDPYDGRIDDYRNSIIDTYKKWQSQVVPIGKKWAEIRYRERSTIEPVAPYKVGISQGLMYIKSGGKVYLASIKAETSDSLYGFSLITFITKDMKDAALEKSRKSGNQTLPPKTIDAAHVKGFSISKIPIDAVLK